MKTKSNEYPKYIDAVNSFRKCLKEVSALEASLAETVKNADQAMGDCRHKLELDYPTSAKERTAICKAIRKASQERREAKDALSVLEGLVAFAESHKSLANELDAVYGKMAKAMKSVEGPRSYRTRVLSDMFGTEIIGKDGKQK